MKILVLDDNEIRLRYFKKHLAPLLPDCVMTAKEAIEKLSETDFDVVFLDHDLGNQEYQTSGDGTGYEVAQWLSNHPEKKPKKIVIHSFNACGARKMLALLPEAEYTPGTWLEKSLYYIIYYGGQGQG